MTSTYNLATEVDDHVLAWDILNEGGCGSAHQPWRAFWPPKKVDQIPPDELAAKPWLTWRRDPSQPNEKPWYGWCNVFEGEVDLPCQNRPGTTETPPEECQHCKGKGCVR